MTVLRPLSSRVVDSTPLGLLSMRYTALAGLRTTGRPSTATRSSSLIGWWKPVIVSPLTCTLPSRMASAIQRLGPIPVAVRALMAGVDDISWCILGSE